MTSSCLVLNGRSLPKTRLIVTRALVIAIGLFLVVYGLWYELKGNTWDYLAVTGNIYWPAFLLCWLQLSIGRELRLLGASTALILGAMAHLPSWL